MKYITYIKNFFLLYILLNLSWIIFAQNTEFKSIFIGAFASSFVIICAINFTDIRLKEKFSMMRFIIYIFWLIGEIISSSLKVSKIILSKEIKIIPAHKIIKTKINGDASKTIFANSITLTPGTLCTLIDENKLEIHALSGSRDIYSLENSIMENFVKKIGD